MNGDGGRGVANQGGAVTILDEAAMAAAVAGTGMLEAPFLRVESMFRDLGVVGLGMELAEVFKVMVFLILAEAVTSFLASLVVQRGTMLVITMAIGAIPILVFREGAHTTLALIVLAMEGTNRGGIQGVVAPLLTGLVRRGQRVVLVAALTLTSYSKRFRQ
jgi:hypothetical protein